jgi:hypothetical protein
VHIPVFELFWLAQAYVPALRGGFVGHLGGADRRRPHLPAGRRRVPLGGGAGPAPAPGARAAPAAASGATVPPARGAAAPPAPPVPRHAAGPHRRPTAGRAARRRHPAPAAHRLGDPAVVLERAARVRATGLHAGS